MILISLKKTLKIIRNPIFIIILLIIISGLILRFHDLGSQSVWYDEAISAIASRELINTGTFTQPSGAPYTRAALNRIFIAISYSTLGFTTLAGRVPAAIFGTLSIPLAFVLGRRIKNDRVGLIICFLVAFSTVQIAWSRQIRMYQLLQFLFLGSLLGLERILDETNWTNLTLFLIPTLLMTISHDSFGYLLAAIIGSSFLITKSRWIKYKISDLKTVSKRDLLGVLSVFTALLMIILFRGVPWDGFERILTPAMDYWSNYINYIRFEMGALFYLVLPGAFLGILMRRRNITYIFPVLIYMIVISYSIMGFHHRYVFILFPILFAFSALTLDYVYERITNVLSNKKTFPKSIRKVIPSLLIILLMGGMCFSANLTFSPTSHYDLGRTAPQGQFNQAYTYISDNLSEDDVIISTLTPVSWYYLEMSDYWISFSLWGYRELPEEETYTKADAIKTVQNIEKATENYQGWIIIDLMGMSRASTEVLEYIDNNFRLIEEVSGREKGVWVYRFVKTD